MSYSQSTFLFEASDEDSGVVSNGYSSDPRNPVLQKSISDIDGGAFPEWNSKFVLRYKPPKLTSCKVVFTDVMKIMIDDSLTYVVVMVREAKDKSIFMTAYDSRTATEYKLLGGPSNWGFAGINDSQQPHPFDKCYPSQAKDNRITVFSEELEACIHKSEQLLGFTPANAAQAKDTIKLGEVRYSSVPHPVPNLTT